MPNAYLPRSPGASSVAGMNIHSVHCRDWVRACKEGEITNNRDANKWVKPVFRKGWELKL